MNTKAPLFFTLILSWMVPLIQANEVSFSRHVAPILLQRCAGCHGPKKAEGGFRLHTFQFLTTLADSGNPLIVSGQPERSELFRRLVESSVDLRMPQEDDALGSAEIDVIRQWILSGAKFDGEDEAVAYRSQLPPRNHPTAPEFYRTTIPIYALAFSPNGTQLAVGGYHEINVWDSASGQLTKRIGNLPQRIQEIAWLDEQQLVVSGGTPGEYGEVCVADISSQSRIRVIGTFTDIVMSIGLNSTKDQVVAGCADQRSRVYSVTDGKLLWEAQVHSDWVTGAKFSSDDRFVATSSRDQTVKVHEAKEGTLYTTYNGHRKQLGEFTGRFAVYDVCFHPETGEALSLGEGEAIRIWNPEKAHVENGDASDMEGRFFKKGHTRFVRFGAESPMFHIAVVLSDILISGRSGVVKSFDFSTGEPKQTFQGHDDWIFCVDGNMDATRIAAGSFNGTVIIWDALTGETCSQFKAAPGLEK